MAVKRWNPGRELREEAESEFAALRDGMRTILAMTLKKAVDAFFGPLAHRAGPGSSGDRDWAAHAFDLERAAYSVSAHLTASATHRRQYADVLRALNAALPVQTGPYPDDIPALMFLAGRRTAESLVEESQKPADEPLPRELTLRMFVRTLMAADARYGADREGALAAARAIEAACYNAAVRMSKESEEPPRRQWDSPAFVDIYSTRCGTVSGLLDPGSSACRAYGAALVPRLLAGELAPGALGDMAEKALCPQATAAERATIAKREAQTVSEKASILFRCPHCGERRSTYREIQRRALDEGADYLCRCLNPLCRRMFNGRS